MGVDLIAYQKAFSLHGIPKLGAFASRRCAQIQHLLPRLYGKQGRRGHGACLLDIVSSRFMKGMSAGALLFLIIISPFRPGYRFFLGKKAQGLLKRILQVVDPEGKISGMLIALQKSSIFFSEHVFHSG